jgi:ABC-type amino acid transport substrate-binding protein
MKIGTAAGFAALAFLLAQADASAAPPEHWIVATTPSPPFVIEEPDGSLSGLAVALWRVVADDLGVSFELRNLEPDALWRAIADGKVDLAIGRLDVTAERERIVDFTHPFYSDGLGVATALRGDPGWRGDVASLLSGRVLRIVGVSLCLALLVAALVWRLERKRNPSHFEHGFRGLGDGLWWSVVTMSTVGYGDKAPITHAGRTLAATWIFVSLVLIASITGAIASSLTVSQLQGAIHHPGDLARVRVAAVEGSIGAGWLDGRKTGYRSTADVRAALELLSAGRVDAVVHDAPVLKYLGRTEFAGETELHPLRLEREDYSFALPPGSPQRERVTEALIASVRKEPWARIVQLYLGD